MGEVLAAFGRAFAASAALALPAAFLWGVLSVVLSPCHLASIPLVVAYMGGGEEIPAGRRAVALASSFAAGILVSIAIVGLVTAAAGRMAGDLGRAGSYALAAVFLGVGLNLLGLLPAPSFFPRPSAPVRRGAVGACVLGLGFGAFLGPCTFAFMAPLLALVFQAGSRSASYGALLVASYGLGHAVAIAAAGASAQLLRQWLAWRAGARVASRLRSGAGAAVIAGGLYVLYTAP